MSYSTGAPCVGGVAVVWPHATEGVAFNRAKSAVIVIARIRIPFLTTEGSDLRGPRGWGLSLFVSVSGSIRLCAASQMRSIRSKIWRRDRESNPGARICSPLRHHSAIAPRCVGAAHFCGFCPAVNSEYAVVLKKCALFLFRPMGSVGDSPPSPLD